MKREYEDYLRDMLEKLLAESLKMFVNQILKFSGAKLLPCETN